MTKKEVAKQLRAMLTKAIRGDAPIVLYDLDPNDFVTKRKKSKITR